MLSARMPSARVHFCYRLLPGWPEEDLDALLPLPGFVFVREGA
ncbi:hypothetical protein ECA0157_17206 [Escherichia coli ECA-0157]|jgi:hypothetical protein|nr:hypothetical protein [Enterobacter cloacae]EST81601.1 hypothetical protein ECA0157_17206 [Escherichia coli ECA-0157]